jgi:hypothetical protein
MALNVMNYHIGKNEQEVIARQAKISTARH